MSSKNIILPSNKKFGFFFSIVFLIVSVFFYFQNNNFLIFFFSCSALFLFVVTIINAEILLPLNKLWMKFGILLGMIVSPIILGSIYFFIFTPIGLLMKIFGRDELILVNKIKNSYWLTPQDQNELSNFRNQF